MITQQPRPNNGKVVVLVAAGFKEGEAIYCLDRLREAGISVSLVGVSAGLISGAHGVTVRPDCTLEQLTVTPPPRIALIPGGKKAAAALLSDPRVHRLLTAVVQNNGVIAAMPDAVSLLNGVTIEGINTSIAIISPNSDSLDEFINRLINRTIS